MDKKKKGLADAGEGEFILNESGTSVSTDKVNDDQDSDSIVSDNETEESEGDDFEEE